MVFLQINGNLRQQMADPEIWWRTSSSLSRNVLDIAGYANLMSLFVIGSDSRRQESHYWKVIMLKYTIFTDIFKVIGSTGSY